MEALNHAGSVACSADLAYGVQPIRGERVCGDCCAVWQQDGRLILAVADGLGHGAGAARAAEAAIQCIAQHLSSSCEVIFAHCDAALRATRGVALALALVELERNVLTLASVGNIRSVLLSAHDDLRLGGACGIVGGGFRDLAPEKHSLADGDMLYLYTDGFDELLPLRTQLMYGPYPAAQSQVSLALSTWANGRDDAGMLVYRHRSPI